MVDWCSSHSEVERREMLYSRAWARLIWFSVWVVIMGCTFNMLSYSMVLPKSGLLSHVRTYNNKSQSRN